MKRVLFVFVLLLPLLSSCQTVQEQPLSASPNDYLFTATPIPTAVTQMLTLQEKMASGSSLTAQAEPDIYTFTTVDFYGAPFMHFTITAPRSIGDPWEFASNLTGDEWADQGDETPWTVTVTGATDARSLISIQERGLGSFLDVYETMKALGGPSNLNKIVSSSSTAFLLEDKAGKLWDTSTHEVVIPELLQAAREQYDEVVASNATAEAQAFSKAAWAPLLEEGAARDVQGTVLSNGNLDVNAFTQSFSAQYRKPNDAYNFIRGAMPKLEGKTFFTKPSGYDQDTYYYGRGYGNDWPVYGCTLGRLIDKKSIGCGPASFAGLLDFQFKYRGKRILNRSYDSRNGSASRTGMLYALTTPVGVEKRPMIAVYMSTCWFGDGALTRAGQYIDGMKDFIRDYAPTLRTTYSASVGFKNNSNALDKLNILKWAMWRSSTGWPKSSSSEVPVVAQFFYSTGRAHYSAVIEWRYRLRSPSSSVHFLEVRTEDLPGSWIGITDTLNYETGVYAIY